MVRSSLHFCFLLAAFTIFLASCSTPHPAKGGHALTRPSAAGVEQSLSQPDNPAALSRQNQEVIKTRTYTLPAGSLVSLAPPPPLPLTHALPLPPPPTKTVSALPASAPSSFPSLASVNSGPGSSSCVLSSPVLVSEREELRANTELGAAHKDTAREIGAKLTALKPIVWVGLALFLFALASIFYPPLKLAIGSLTTSLALAAGGLALVILPTLLVGNELLILGIVAATTAAWFLAHRHGTLRGQLAAAKAGARGHH